MCVYERAHGLHLPSARTRARRRCHLRAAAVAVGVCVCVCMYAHGFGFTTGMRRHTVVPLRRPTCSTGAAAALSVHLCAGIVIVGRTLEGSCPESARPHCCQGPSPGLYPFGRYRLSGPSPKGFSTHMEASVAQQVGIDASPHPASPSYTADSRLEMGTRSIVHHIRLLFYILYYYYVLKSSNVHQKHVNETARRYITLALSMLQYYNAVTLRTNICNAIILSFVLRVLRRSNHVIPTGRCPLYSYIHAEVIVLKPQVCLSGTRLPLLPYALRRIVMTVLYACT